MGQLNRCNKYHGLTKDRREVTAFAVAFHPIYRRDRSDEAPPSFEIFQEKPALNDHQGGPSANSTSVSCYNGPSVATCMTTKHMPTLACELSTLIVVADSWMQSSRFVDATHKLPPQSAI
ncbi:hypothetical protein EVAR_60816_1 [Eumeta japonica]|uniref:Uncharacterized protein n=1 Tax=Eumeta variegata TaxID=151549 RepID=A0A4C1YPF1_EUMVA|nr:hypothetical protein EVAR_60816_1 [Eumeta japonica]